MTRKQKRMLRRILAGIGLLVLAKLLPIPAPWNMLLFLAAWVLRMFDGVIPDPVLERSVLLEFFCTFNPLSLISGI